MADTDPTTEPTTPDTDPTTPFQAADTDPTIEPTNSSDEKKSINELMERYKIGRDQLYKRMGYLQIRTWKAGGRSYLDDEQIRHMDGLHDHIQQTKVMTGYPVPPPSGPSEEETPDQSEILASEATAIAIVDSTQLGEPLPHSAVSPQIADDELDAIDRQAQFIAASRYVATQELASYYAHTGNFTIPEVIERIQQRQSQTQNQWEAAHRSADPNQLTQLLLKRAKQRAQAAGRSLPLC